MVIDKKTLKGGFAACAGSYFRLFKQSEIKHALTVFLYHDVTYSPSEFSKMYNLNVPPDLFDFQLKYIKSCFNVITPDELIRGEIPPRAAMVTFDDGVKGFFSDAAEIIEHNKVPTVIFLNTQPVSGVIFRSGLITYLCVKEEGFKEYLINAVGKGNLISPLFLNCTRAIVDSYVQRCGKDFKEAVEGFVGQFASDDDLKKTSESKYIYYGNHLYNHDVALTLSDDELRESYMKNMEVLLTFKNFTNLFAFPFGQPRTTFSERQIDLIVSYGAKKVFSSYPVINYNPLNSYLHRIDLTDFNDTRSKIWYQVFYAGIRNNSIFKSLKKALSK
ncbi:MAG: polysaccharide deacetylase family protein [Nitrospirae bacterium]|nr:polysaccharide deacetylase family protein [Nitrospirota bacterium]